MVKRHHFVGDGLKTPVHRHRKVIYSPVHLTIDIRRGAELTSTVHSQAS